MFFSPRKSNHTIRHIVFELLRCGNANIYFNLSSNSWGTNILASRSRHFFGILSIAYFMDLKFYSLEVHSSYVIV